MKLFYLEARKGILCRSVFIALILFLCLDTLKIGLDYRAGAIREVIGNTEGMQAGFAEIYDKVYGPITNKTAGFLVGEYQRLSQAVADGTYSRKPQEDTYSGYIFGDYFLISSYFYPQMSYSVQYSNRMAERLEQEADNLKFYQSVGNKFMAAKSAYILQRYAGRSISSFYLMDSWESLLRYDFSDLLILLLMILGVAASFTREKETGMTMLLSSSKRGGWPVLASKCGAAVFYAIGLTIIFSLLNLMAYGILFGLQGWDCPLYAIESYQDTPFGGTVGQFYLLSCGMLKRSVFLLCLCCCFCCPLALGALCIPVFSEWVLAQRPPTYPGGQLQPFGGKVCCQRSARSHSREHGPYGAVCAGTDSAAFIYPAYSSSCSSSSSLLGFCCGQSGGNHVKNGMEKTVVLSARHYDPFVVSTGLCGTLSGLRL